MLLVPLGVRPRTGRRRESKRPPLIIDPASVSLVAARVGGTALTVRDDGHRGPRGLGAGRDHGPAGRPRRRLRGSRLGPDPLTALLAFAVLLVAQSDPRPALPRPPRQPAWLWAARPMGASSCSRSPLPALADRRDRHRVSVLLAGQFAAGAVIDPLRACSAPIAFRHRLGEDRRDPAARDRRRADAQALADVPGVVGR